MDFYQDNKVVLSDELIIEKIKNKKELDFTAHDPNENGSSSPLMYAIRNDKKELFNLLLENNVDINYQLNVFKWNALTYALRSKNPYYLETLLSKPEVDLYHKVDDMNYLSHIMSIQLFHEILTDKEMIYNTRLFIKHLKKVKNFDAEKFDVNSLFERAWPHKIHYKTLINHLPNELLTQAINYTTHSNYALPHVALKVFEGINTDSLLIKKMAKKLNVNEILDDKGNTLLHYYLLKNYPSRGVVGKVSDKVVKALVIDNHFDPNLKNKEGKDVLDKIQQMSFFEEYEKSILEKNINENSVKNKKLKI
jgi:ankyrin repeat protein